MILIKVKEAKYRGNYKLELVFNDGLNGVIDLEKQGTAQADKSA